MDYGHEFAEDEISKIEKELKSEYSKAYKEIVKKQKEFLKEFEEELVINKKKLDEGKMTKIEFERFVRENAIKKEWYNDMVDTLALELTDTNKAASKIINEHIKTVYAENMNYSTYIVEGGSGIDTAFTLFDRKLVEEIIKEEPELVSLTKINKSVDVMWNKKQFNSCITQALIQGESIDQVATAISTVVGMGMNAAYRNSRTAITNAESSGRINAYARAKNMGIEVRKQWIATRDSRTRHSHVVLDMEIKELDEEFSNGCFNPGDANGRPEEIYNCRCTIVPVLPGYELSVSDLGDVVNGVSYDGWKKQHLEMMELENEFRNIGR